MPVDLPGKLERWLSRARRIHCFRFNSIIGLAAEAFAREKREDTLGLLFLTPLKPRDLVLGKFVSTALGGFYRFVAVVPVLALPMLGGGVTFGDFARLVLVLSNLAFFTTALGLYVSARSWDEKRAAGVARTTLVVVALLPYFLALLSAAAAGWRSTVATMISSASPAFPVLHVVGMGSAPPFAFWSSLLLTHLTGWLFLRQTCRVLPRCWQEKPVVAEPHRYARLRRETKFEGRGSPAPVAVHARPATLARAARRAVRRQFDRAQRAVLLDRNPIIWFALRWRADTTGAWLVGALMLVGFIGIGMSGNLLMLFTPQFALFVCYFFNAGLKTYACTQASLALARDRAENSLELLLATPITARELVQGHLIAVREPLRKLVRAALLGEASCLALTLPFHRTEQTALCIVIGIAMLAFLVADLYAIGWVALWEGAVAKDARTAAGNAQAKVLLLPWLPFLGLLPLPYVFGWRTSPWFGLGVLVAGSALADWWFARLAQQKLQTALPQLARRRAEGEVEFFDTWGASGPLARPTVAKGVSAYKLKYCKTSISFLKSNWIVFFSKWKSSGNRS